MNPHTRSDYQECAPASKPLLKIPGFFLEVKRIFNSKQNLSVPFEENDLLVS